MGNPTRETNAEISDPEMSSKMRIRMIQMTEAMTLCDIRLYYQVMMGCLRSPTIKTRNRMLVGMIT